MPEFICPVCCSNECKIEDDQNGYYLIRCIKGYTFAISESIKSCTNDDEIDKIYNLILECLIIEPRYNKQIYWKFNIDPYNKKNMNTDQGEVNLADALSAYPANFLELANRSIIFLSRLHPKFGEVISSTYIDDHASFSFGKHSSSDAYDFFHLLVNFGYLSYYHGSSGLFCITPNGWKKIDELIYKQSVKKQGFIAMWFSDQTIYIREAFREIITDAGYSVRLIDEKEHNNQIVPEIFYEIQQSKFMVVDVTYPNYGAYYEAGYAQGIGKEVIVCCSRDAFDNKEGNYTRPHFDISQKSMVFWNDIDDLKIRLRKRIKATVK